MSPLRIATRASKLARWQAERVATLLRTAHGIDVELVFVSTTGDQRRDVPIHELGGTGVFVKEVQQTVLDGNADVAVHSAKDLPSTEADGLAVACVPERADARDVLVGAPLAALPEGAAIATGSVRRRSQLAARRPDLRFHELRGNIDTRLDRAPEFDAIVLAAAGIERIGRGREITEYLDFDVMLPQVGQGALAIECRSDDAATRQLLGAINHRDHFTTVTCERAFLAAVGGGCDAPIGAHASMHDEEIALHAIICDAAGVVHHAHERGTEPTLVGRAAAAQLERFASAR